MNKLAYIIASVCIIATLVINAAVAHFMLSKVPKSIVGVNLVTITKAYVEQLAPKTRSAAEDNKSIEQFSTRLQRALDNLSKKKHVIVVVGQAIIVGAPDKTHDIMKAVGLDTREK